MQRSHAFTFAATFLFVAAVMILSSLIAGNRQTAFYWILFFGLIGLGVGFMSAAMKTGRAKTDSTRLVSQTGSSPARTGAMETSREVTDEELNPEPSRPVADDAAQAGWTEPAASEQPTVSEPLTTENGDQVSDAEIVYTDPIDRAAVDKSVQDDIDVGEKPVSAEDVDEGEDALVYEEETTGEEMTGEGSGTGDVQVASSDVAPAEAQPATDSERRQKAVNEDELETDDDRREESATGETVADEEQTGKQVEVGELTSAPPSTEEEEAAQDEIVETGSDEPEASDEPDDLKRIEGIGPAMSRALVSEGVDTFAKLAALSLDEIREKLDAAGQRFAPAAESWAEQAGYAAKGDWDGLDALQDRLVAGRYPDEDDA